MREREQWGGRLGGVPATTYLSEPFHARGIYYRAKAQGTVPVVAGTNQRDPTLHDEQGLGKGLRPRNSFSATHDQTAGKEKNRFGLAVDYGIGIMFRSASARYLSASEFLHFSELEASSVFVIPSLIALSSLVSIAVPSIASWPFFQWGHIKVHSFHSAPPPPQTPTLFSPFTRFLPVYQQLSCRIVHSGAGGGQAYDCNTAKVLHVVECLPAQCRRTTSHRAAIPAVS